MANEGKEGSSIAFAMQTKLKKDLPVSEQFAEIVNIREGKVLQSYCPSPGAFKTALTSGQVCWSIMTLAPSDISHSRDKDTPMQTPLVHSNRHTIDPCRRALHTSDGTCGFKP